MFSFLISNQSHYHRAKKLKYAIINREKKLQRNLIKLLREVISACCEERLKVAAEQLGTTRFSFLRIVLYVSLIKQTAICTIMTRFYGNIETLTCDAVGVKCIEVDLTEAAIYI